MLTRSSDSSPHTPASAPGLFGRRRFSSVRIAMRGSLAEARGSGLGARGSGWSLIADSCQLPISCQLSAAECDESLREYFDDDAAVLRAARLRLVRRDRMVLAVAVSVDLVRRPMVLLVGIPLPRFGALEPDPLVHLLVA